MPIFLSFAILKVPAVSLLEVLAFQMAYNNDAREYHPSLIRLAYNKVPSVVPARSFVNDMTQRILFFTQPQDYRVTSYLAGDLRGEGVTRAGQHVPGAYGTFTFQGTEVQLIYKYFQATTYNGSGYDPQNETGESGLRFTRQIPLMRTPHARVSSTRAYGGYPDSLTSLSLFHAHRLIERCAWFN